MIFLCFKIILLLLYIKKNQPQNVKYVDPYKIIQETIKTMKIAGNKIMSIKNCKNYKVYL